MCRPRPPGFVPVVVLLLLSSPTWAQKDKSDAKPTGPENPSAQGWYSSRATAEGRQKLVEDGGGTEKSEAAVAAGLKWLAGQQKKDGTWAFDNGGDKAAATGLGLLPFLGAGFSHTQKENNPHRAAVDNGLKALLKLQKADGTFSTSTYANAIAVLAVCEALGLTADRALVKPAQAAVDAIQKGQGKDGSWGYKYGDDGDTSILGWQVQALQGATMCKGLKVDPKVLKKAMLFLEKVASKPKGGTTACIFGYRTPGARPSLAAVGLLSEYTANGWGPDSRELQDGVDYLLKNRTGVTKETFDVYFCYYATQVVRFRGGAEWVKDWNPKVRDLLVELQVSDPKKPAVDGSWDKDGTWIGDSCGRMGTTAMAVLTLEVYYRHLPLEELAKAKKPDGK